MSSNSQDTVRYFAGECPVDTVRTHCSVLLAHNQQTLCNPVGWTKSLLLSFCWTKSVLHQFLDSDCCWYIDVRPSGQLLCWRAFLTAEKRKFTRWTSNGSPTWKSFMQCACQPCAQNLPTLQRKAAAYRLRHFSNSETISKNSSIFALFSLSPDFLTLFAIREMHTNLRHTHTSEMVLWKMNHKFKSSPDPAPVQFLEFSCLLLAVTWASCWSLRIERYQSLIVKPSPLSSSIYDLSSPEPRPIFRIALATKF